MSNFPNIQQSCLNENPYNYFTNFQEDSYDKNDAIYKITTKMLLSKSDNFDSHDENQRGNLQLQKSGKTQNLIQKKKRQKRIRQQIKVKEIRNLCKYVSAKKGKGQQTHQLSVNAGTIIKSLCCQYRNICRDLGIEMDLSDAIEEFIEARLNIKSIQKLMEQRKKQQNRGQQQVESQQDDRQISLSRFLRHKFEQSDILANIMKSKKMKFANKITMLKYFPKLLEMIQNPCNFKNWKNNFN